MALCSLSTGRTATPRRRAAAITIAPAITSTSLLARAMVLPASIAASTASSAAGAGRRAQHDVDVRVGGDRDQTVAARSARAAPLSAAAAELGRTRRDAPPPAGHRDARRRVARRPARPARRRCRRPRARRPEPIGMRVDDRQRALADRAGRAEDGDALHQNLEVARRRRRRPGPANSQLSMRSSTPPWPGISADRSLTPALRFSSDSNRSPTMPSADDRGAEQQQRSAAACRETRACRRAAIAAPPKTTPPIAPSSVFFGLIAGASGRRPNARPV